jgi:hypothetical protein
MLRSIEASLFSADDPRREGTPRRTLLTPARPEAIRRGCTCDAIGANGHAAQRWGSGSAMRSRWFLGGRPQTVVTPAGV